MRLPLLVIAASFASFHCTRGFVLSGSSARSRGSASSELHRTYSRGFRSSNTNTAMHRRAALGRGNSPLAMSDRLTVGRERRFFNHVRICGACFRGAAWGRCIHSSGVVKSAVIWFMFVQGTCRVVRGYSCCCTPGRSGTQHRAVRLNRHHMCDDAAVASPCATTACALLMYTRTLTSRVQLFYVYDCCRCLKFFSCSDACTNDDEVRRLELLLFV